jgi:hypothetical protein
MDRVSWRTKASPGLSTARQPPGLRFERGVAHFSKLQATLGVVPTAAMVRQAELRLSFEFTIDRCFGSSLTLLTLGGKTRRGTIVRSAYDEAQGADVLQVRQPGNQWVSLGPLPIGRPHPVEVRLGRSGYALSLDGAPPREFAGALLRKLAIGGLDEPPEWPAGTGLAIGMRMPLDGVTIA